jgi:hypothetical protein
VSFWPLRRRRKEGDSLATPTATPIKPGGTGLSVVELWTADQRATVGIDLSQGRLTDLFNREDTIRVVLLDAPPEDPSKLVEKRPEQEWVELEVEQALLVFPPPQVTNPTRRLHRPKQPIEIVIGPFEISGTVSIPPGAQAAGFIFRQNVRFTPVTRAAVRDTRLVGFEQRAEVVLVNLRRVATIRDLGITESDEGDLGEPDLPDLRAPGA